MSGNENVLGSAVQYTDAYSTRHALLIFKDREIAEQCAALFLSPDTLQGDPVKIKERIFEQLVEDREIDVLRIHNGDYYDKGGVYDIVNSGHVIIFQDY